LAAHRPDFVKIWVDDRSGRQKKLTPELYTAAADEAIKHNLRPIAHVFDLVDAKGLVKAGVVGFMHMVRDDDIDDELIALLTAHPGTFFGPNIGITSRASSRAGRNGSTRRCCTRRFRRRRLRSSGVVLEPAGSLERTRRIRARETQHREARQRRELALGSDSAGDPSRFSAGMRSGKWRVRDGGIPPMEVITMSTKTAAEILRLDQLGTVANGKAPTSSSSTQSAGQHLECAKISRSISGGRRSTAPA
jgi:imidazolonepropionase-like amidohydrolase